MKKNLIIALVIVGIIIIAGILITMQLSFQSKPIVKPIDNSINPATNPPIVPSAGSKEYNIEIKSFAFSPAALTLKKGDKVTWTNMDSVPHTITSDTGTEINSASLSDKETYSKIFDKTGTYSYHCTIHPSMKAKIIVE